MTHPLDTRLSTLLEQTPGTLHLINTPPAVLKHFINTAYTHDTLPTIRIFAPKDTYDELATNFIIAAKAHALTTTHNIELRIGTLDTPPTIVYDNTVIATIHTHLLEDTNAELANELHTLISDKWDTTTAYTFTHPTLSTIYDTLADTISPDVALTTQSLIETLTTTHPNATVTLPQLVLLAAAHDNTAFRTVVEWANTLGITSRGTLSRERQHLETHNLISTTHNTTGPGRPHLTLHPPDTTTTDTPPIESHLNVLTNT